MQQSAPAEAKRFNQFPCSRYYDLAELAVTTCLTTYIFKKDGKNIG
jgi:hypothetical protein